MRDQYRRWRVLMLRRIELWALGAIEHRSYASTEQENS
jgi:hypothetical protein